MVLYVVAACGLGLLAWYMLSQVGILIKTCDLHKILAKALEKIGYKITFIPYSQNLSGKTL